MECQEQVRRFTVAGRPLFQGPHPIRHIRTVERAIEAAIADEREALTAERRAIEKLSPERLAEIAARVEGAPEPDYARNTWYRYLVPVLLAHIAAVEAERDEARESFEQHTKAVGDFLGELYAISVDPLAEGTIPVAEMKVALTDAALLAREHINAIQDERDALAAKIAVLREHCCQCGMPGYEGTTSEDAVEAALRDEEAPK